MDSNLLRKKRKQEFNLWTGYYSNDFNSAIEDGTENHMKVKMKRSADASGARRRPLYSTISKSLRFQENHRERERERRRELSILYELIRRCITEDDVCTYLPGRKNSVDKLSHLEILEISTLIVPDERHDLKVSENLMEDIERLEALCQRIGLPLDFRRPRRNYMQCHQDIAAIMSRIVDENKGMRKDDIEVRFPFEIAEEECYKFMNYLKGATDFRITNRPTNIFSSFGRKQSIVNSETGACRRRVVRKNERCSMDTHLRPNSNQEPPINAEINSYGSQNIAYSPFESTSTESEASNSSIELDDETLSVISKELDFDVCLPLSTILEVEPTPLQHSSSVGCSADLELSKDYDFSDRKDKIKECEDHLLNQFENNSDEIPSEIVSLFEDYASPTANLILPTCENFKFSEADAFHGIKTFPDCGDLDYLCSSIPASALFSSINTNNADIYLSTQDQNLTHGTKEATMSAFLSSDLEVKKHESINHVMYKYDECFPFADTSSGSRKRSAN